MSPLTPARRPWTADEQKKLEDMLDAGKTVVEIALVLERSRLAIYARLQRLYRNGLSRRPAGRARSESKMKQGPRPINRPWTPEEDAQLLALLESKMERPLIARKLKRTVVAITIRLMVLRGKTK